MKPSDSAKETICTECGIGNVLPKTGLNRKYTYRPGCELELPNQFEVPTCDKCGAELFDMALDEAAVAELRPQFIERQKSHIEFLISTIIEVTSYSIRDIEHALGVTPTYLSHVTAGRMEASDTLIGLLEEFALHPFDIKRRLNRTDPHDTLKIKKALREAHSKVTLNSDS